MPGPDGSAELLAWNLRDESERMAIIAELIALVAAKLRADRAPDYPGALQQEPRIHVYAAAADDRRLTVHFVADHLLYCFAQSGSDWADHYIFVGDATFVDHTRAAARLARVETVHLSEHEADAYDPHAVVATVRDAAIAMHRGASLAEAATTELVRATYAAVDPERADARARSAAVPTIDVAVRCPKCGSTAAGAIDYVFENTLMKCQPCGHEEYADNAEVGERWNVRLPPGTTALPASLPPLAASSVELPASPQDPPPPRSPTPAAAPSPPSPARATPPTPSSRPLVRLRCPRCGSTNVGEDDARNEFHFTFLACRRCDHGELINSLTAASNWRADS